LGGKLWVSYGPVAYDAVRLPRVGIEHIARAKIVRRDAESLAIRAATSTQEGKPCGTLDSTWRPADRAAVERAGVPLPAYLLAEFDR
jgi:hypothetical protein